MHSYNIAKNIMQTVYSEASKYQGEQIKSMVIELSSNDFTKAESVQFCLESMTVSTLMEGVPIEISMADAEMKSHTPKVVLN